MKKRIFYSWQSDLPNNTNRGFINTAIEKAINEINADDSFDLIPFLDRDTMGVPGSPDISTSIFEKIDDSSVFICDVSIINGGVDNGRSTPNPNVLIELGYAISKLSWNKIILVMNEEYGKVESLPFDLRGRKVLTYSISRDSESKTDERKKVSKILKNGIKEILIYLDKPSSEKKENDGRTNKEAKPNNKTLAQEAKAMLGAVKSMTRVPDKNKEATKFAEKYITNGRLDLAVGFVLLITRVPDKNRFLIQIAESSIKSHDIETANKAIAGITRVPERNRLSKRLLELAS